MAEYELTGIKHIWLIDARLSMMFVYATGKLTAVDERLDAGDISVTAGDVFSPC